MLKQVVGDIAPVLDEHYFTNQDHLIGGLSYLETRDQINSLLKGISMGADRIRDIVANLKEFASVDTGSMKQEIHVNEVVIAALLIVGNLIKKSTETFSVHYDQEIPVVAGNIQQIEQVIINLLTNACQALPDRTCAVSVITSFNAKTRHACVTITDEGVGISEDNRNHLFYPFFTTKRDKGGTGLGLSVSYSIVQAHKGELVINSTEKKGTGGHYSEDYIFNWYIDI
jgi:two-component system NtrC family sensor kinase